MNKSLWIVFLVISTCILLFCCLLQFGYVITSLEIYFNRRSYHEEYHSYTWAVAVLALIAYICCITYNIITVVAYPTRKGTQITELVIFAIAIFLQFGLTSVFVVAQGYHNYF